MPTPSRYYNVTYTYTYDANGMRTSRSNGSKTYSYVYNGSKLTQMTVGNYTLNFTYDASGVPMTMSFNGTVYYYATNLQGDVVSILNAAGEELVHYTYDAWGNKLSKTGSKAATLGWYNPLRYRGYVFDEETDLYYLQSRYYNPQMGRFISADATDVLTATPMGVTDKNLFAYCDNNPITRKDDGGQFWNFVIGAAVGALIGAVTTAIDAIQADGWAALSSGKTWAKIGVSAVCGAINGTVAASGAHVLVGGFVGSATGFVESLSHELIDNDGEMDDKSWAEVAIDTAAGFAGGLAGGNGAIYKNKYMSQQGARWLKHVGSDGLKKASSFYYKMTANYSKRFVKNTLLGLAKGWVGGKTASMLLA